MRPLRYSINVTLDGCCDQREILGDEDMHRHAVKNLAQGGGSWADIVRGLSKRVDLRLVGRLEFGSGAVAMRYEPRG